MDQFKYWFIIPSAVVLLLGVAYCCYYRQKRNQNEETIDFANVSGLKIITDEEVSEDAIIDVKGVQSEDIYSNLSSIQEQPNKKNGKKKNGKDGKRMHNTNHLEGGDGDVVFKQIQEKFKSPVQMTYGSLQSP
jgi:hypothetical protein